MTRLLSKVPPAAKVLERSAKEQTEGLIEFRSSMESTLKPKLGSISEELVKFGLVGFLVFLAIAYSWPIISLSLFNFFVPLAESICILMLSLKRRINCEFSAYIVPIFSANTFISVLLHLVMFKFSSSYLSALFCKSSYNFDCWILLASSLLWCGSLSKASFIFSRSFRNFLITYIVLTVTDFSSST